VIEREDLTRYKPRLRDYLVRRGVQITTTDADRIVCLSGSHADSHPSMVVYEETLWCASCGCRMDIFEAARVLGGLSSSASEFPKVIEEVKTTLGDFSAAPAQPAPAPRRQPRNTTAVSLTRKEGQRYYTKTEIKRMASFGLGGKDPAKVFVNGRGVTALEGTWVNCDPDGKVAFIEARYPAKDFKDGKKKYLTIWFDGEHLKSANPPIALYNRDKLAGTPEADVCIHEGPKSIFGLGELLGGEAIPGFIHSGWNSGGKKWHLADWELLRGRRVFIYPDDDPEGRKTARELKEYLEANYGCTVRIVEPLTEAAALKPTGGADIVEALQIRSPEEMAEYIRSGPSLGPLSSDLPPNATERTVSSTSQDNGTTIQPPRPPAPPLPTGRDALTLGDFPFRILGTADDGQTYFIDRSGRLAKYKLSTLTKSQLQVLAPMSFWSSNYGHKGKVQWDDATDAIIEVSGPVDFDPEVIRGTGAWRERDGRLCYNDGRDIHGEKAEARVYLRRAYRDIGLKDAKASIELRREMVEAAMAMSFETQVDCARLLAWAALASFGGALPWRPSGLITGDSESGKTTALNLVVRPCAAIGDEDICTGGESSGAGVRQHDRYSSRPVVIEEADDDTEKKRRNRDEIFSIMRESTSDDSPKAWKGTIDGQGMSFTMRKMFIFAAISPIVNANADKNRLFFVNMRKAEGGSNAWKPIKRRVQAAFSEANCRALRAFTWTHLAEIIEGADFFSALCEEVGRLSTRYAYLEAILFSAYHIVFKGGLPDEATARKFLAVAYEQQKPEANTNEAQDMVDRLLDEVVPITGDRSKSLPLRSILIAIKTRKMPIFGDMVGEEILAELSGTELVRYKQTAWSYGLGVNRSGELCIQNNHHAITKITGYGKGYSKLLKRHPSALPKKVQGFTPMASEQSRQCTYIASVLETEEVPEWVTEQS
jgi:hypothetical protein